MKRIFLLSVLLAAVLLFAGCAEREPEETGESETSKIGFDPEWYRKEFLAREEQEGYVPFESKYGYDIPEITGFTDGFVDYLGRSVTLSAPYEGANRDFLEDGRGGVFVFRTVRAGGEDGKAGNVSDGIVYYDAEGIPSRICVDPACTVPGPCTHGMEISGSFAQFWDGALYFVGYRQEPWPEGEEHPGIEGLPLRSYVMRYDIEKRTFRKLIEFFDRTCFLMVIRDGVLYLVSGEDAEGDSGPVKYLSSVDLESGEACRIRVGQSDVYGICEGKLVLQSPDYGKQWDRAEYKVELMDPEDGSRKKIASYTSPYCGAAGKYVLYLGRWENGAGYDLYRRDPNSDSPEVLGRNVVKFRAFGDKCWWLCGDGSVWRTDVIAYSPRKIASKAADFRLQDDGRIAYFTENPFRGAKTSGFGIDTLGNGSLWVSNGFHREKIWESSGSVRWLGVCAVGQSVAFVTAMYVEILWPDDYQYRETRIVKETLDGEPPQILYRRLYNMSDEEFRSHQSTVAETYVEKGGYWLIKPRFRYYPIKP
ncbi:MAG: hypothetical protein IIU08_03460 [Clostridia bacterium]|nr:hypothetical protein [Clostridia bacterium]